MKKEIINIDDGACCGTIAFGYSRKKEAFDAITKNIGCEPEWDNLEKRKVLKFKRDGEDYYYWGKICECCGGKNTGYWSYLDMA